MELKARIQEATQAVKHALGGDEQPANEADILDTLKKEHEAVKALLSSLASLYFAEKRRVTLPHTS